MGALAITNATAGADAAVKRAPAVKKAVTLKPTASPWQLVFRDDFSGTALDTNRWGAYEGTAGTGDSVWLRSHVQVARGQLTLRGYKDPDAGGDWATGGIGNRRGLVQGYGKYLVRMRLDKGYGLSYAALLWPESNVAPPEVDFAEGFGQTMGWMKATVHSGTPAQRVVTGKWQKVDMTKWHVVGVEWTPGKLAFTIDNKVWWTLTGAKVPTQRMVLDLQSQIHRCGSAWWTCPNATSPAEMDMHVDWVEAYSYQPAAQQHR